MSFFWFKDYLSDYSLIRCGYLKKKKEVTVSSRGFSWSINNRRVGGYHRIGGIILAQWYPQYGSLMETWYF
jgi:hypothetical protein